MKKLLATLAAVLGAIACGSSGESGDPTSDLSATCATPAPLTPAVERKVSFASDVLPLLVTSCAFGACHGAAKGANNGVFLGAKGAPNDAAAIRAGLVGRPSTQSSLPYVTPSNPSQSYLFRKLTDLCGLPCDGDRCGQRMPRGGDPLDEASLATVRAWIAQGAPE
ncbi:hypothetical protein BH11MYX4_BH11MYX4_04300 [soil metagenome]